jgi:hypothetical protein
MSFARPLYVKNASVVGGTGPTGGVGPQGNAGGLNLYLNQANSSGVVGYQSLSPLVIINPTTYTASLLGNSHVDLKFLTNNPIQNLTEIQNCPVTLYFYGSATAANAYVQLTGNITALDGSSPQQLFDISANIPVTGSTTIVQVYGLITGGPYTISPLQNKLNWSFWQVWKLKINYFIFLKIISQLLPINFYLF